METAIYLKKTLILIFCFSFWSIARADVPMVGDENYKATREYYEALIKDPSANMASITLFMNLMPKGGDIHHHTSGAIYVENYLDTIDKLGYCIYTVNEPSLGIVKFTVESGNIPASLKDWCWSASQIRADDNTYRALLMSWSDKDFGNHFHEEMPPDMQFFSTFPLFGATASYDFNGSLKVLKQRAIEENVQYIETMLVGTPSYTVKPGTELADYARQLNSVAPDEDYKKLEPLFEAIYQQLQKSKDFSAAIAKYLDTVNEAVLGLDDEKFKCRIQAYVFRGSNPFAVFSGLYSGFVADAASQYVVGVNIVGAENGVVAMRDYSLHMKMFHFLKKKIPGTKLSLHAGELALGMVPPEGLTFHIRQAVEVAGAQRIGHGIDILEESGSLNLLKELREKNVLVEINLTSNEFILRVKDGQHPISVYRDNKVPYVISTDDAGVSRNNLSHEYVMYATRYLPSYDALKSTVKRSIIYSFLNEDEKADQLKKLEKKFSEFEGQIAAYQKNR